MKHKQLLISVFTLCIQLTGISQPVIKTQADIGGNDFDELSSIFKSSEENIIIAGHSASNHSKYKLEDSRGIDDYWILKVSLDRASHQFTKLWDRTIGGNESDGLFTCLPTQDNGYILAGRSLSGISGEKTEPNIGGLDYWLVKLDNNGNILWNKTFGTTYIDYISSFDTTHDGGFILLGQYYAVSDHHEVLLKINASGELQWGKDTIKNSGFFYQSIRETKDGGYVLTRADATPNLTKTDRAGNILWEKTYPITYNEFGHTGNFFVQSTKDNGFILYGLYADLEKEAFEDDYHCGVYKTDSTGNLIWYNNDFLSYFGDSRHNSILEQTNDTGYVFGASIDYPLQYYYRKFDKAGHKMWEDTFLAGNDDIISDILPLSSNYYLIGGSSYSGVSGDKTKRLLGNSDFWLLLVQDTSNSNALSSFAKQHERKIPSAINTTIFPNPVKDIMYIQTTGKASYTLTDQSGKVLLTKTITNKGEINVAHFSPGLYYLKNNETGVVQKIIITK